MCAKRYNNKGITTCKLIIITFILLSVFFPLLNMFKSLQSVDAYELLSNASFKKTILNSLISSAISTMLSSTIALIVAWLLLRANIKHKKILAILLTVPMLIPSISHGTGLVILLGNNGVVNNFFNLNINIYGMTGIVIGSILYSFPVAFSMFYDALQYEDGTVYMSADVLGVPKISQIINITFPYLKKTMIAVFFTVFTLVFTDYGIPLMVGGKYSTLPLYMYNEVIGLLDFGKGALIGCILMIPAFVAFTIDVLNKDYDVISYVSNEYIVNNNKKRDLFACIFLSAITIVLLLPILSFTLLMFISKYPIDIHFSLKHILRVLDMNMIDYLSNSIIISVLTACIGTVLCFVTSYITSRYHSKSSKFIHLASMVSLAIPGLVLGLSYSMFFKNTNIYGTIFILVMVNIVHFFSSPYLLSYNAIKKINPNYEAVAQVLGIPIYRLVVDVIIPQVFLSLLEVFSYFFVNSMVTISAISFLVTNKTQTLSLMIPNLESMMLIESIAFVSIVILLVNIIQKCLIQSIKTIFIKKNERGDYYSMNLNKKEFDILTCIEREGKHTQRELAEKNSFSLGTTNATINSLQEKGYIDGDNLITKKGIDALEPFRVKRAIFMAAGFGSRLVPLTINSPKPLIRVNGVRMIDTLLDAVYEAGIEEVVIVRGYLKEQFDQLLYKYPNIKFIDNDSYNESNNIGSAYVAREYLENAYVLEADLVLSNKDLITKYQYNSNYLGVKTDVTDDWCFQVNKNKIITKVMIGGRNVYHMFGISYWNKEDGEKLKKDIKMAFELPGGKERYFDQVPLDIMKKNYKVEVRPCQFKDIVEIDSYSDLKKIDKHYI